MQQDGRQLWPCAGSCQQTQFPGGVHHAATPVQKGRQTHTHAVQVSAGTAEAGWVSDALLECIADPLLECIAGWLGLRAIHPSAVSDALSGPLRKDGCERADPVYPGPAFDVECMAGLATQIVKYLAVIAAYSDHDSATSKGMKGF